MAKLDTTARIARPDYIYQQLIDLHAGLDEEESALANAKLIMLLANHIGDESVLQEAIELAREDQPPAPLD